MPAAQRGKPGPTPPSESVTVSPTGEPEVDGVLSGRKWANNSTTDFTTITYSFPDSSTDYGKGYSEASSKKFSPLNADEQTAARSVMALVESYAKLDLVENTGATDASAQIRIGATVTPGADAWAYYPASGKGGDVWFDKNGGGSGLMSREEGDLDPGDYTYTVYMHEISHALGLKHSFESTSFGIVPVDSLEYTVMSYDAYVGASNTWATDGNNPQTFMMYDIAALQFMYGTNYATNGGDTTYFWNSGNGGLTTTGPGGTSFFDAAPDTSVIFMTMWDGSGNDTYDFSNYATNLEVDLRPGGWTTLDTQTHHQLADLSAQGNDSVLAGGNIANPLVYEWNDNADGAGLIENAIGGSGNDTLIGNAVNNRLTGGAGDDRFVFVEELNATNIDTITDFGVGHDVLVLEDLVFSALAAAWDFVQGPAANDENDHVLYYEGALYYDADGTGIIASVQFATLVGVPVLASADILVA